ncbi:MAG TPA: peptide-methionine (R)-S-oxide reductase MsrB [Patescibacteria group bacterium]|nr:peptide-methionine (R)-S-oxide reductase MsrB [Patescibacteria group bacterium]
MQLSDKEWEQKLTPEQFHVLREKGTEMPFTGKLLYNDAAGSYTCAACGNVLFDSKTKFETDCGWPSFYDAIEGSVKINRDTSHGMIRDEVTCANCGGHLGHVFPDAPDQPGGMRFCVNSAALQFLPKDKKR